jgi:hypothetical protein
MWQMRNCEKCGNVEVEYGDGNLEMLNSISTFSYFHICLVHYALGIRL